MSQIVAVAQSGLRAFFEWWWNELEGLLPRVLSPSRRQRRRLLVLVLGSDGAALFQGSGASRRLIARSEGDDPDELKAAIARAHGRRRRTIVRLPPQRGLRKTLELPVAARDDLDQLLRFEMDRLTPFRAEEVVFAHRIAQIDSQSRRMTIELHLAPKSVVEGALAYTRSLGLVPARVELAAPDATDDDGLDLLPDESGRTYGMSRLNRSLAVLAVLLALAAIGIPLHHQRSTVADLEVEVGAAKAEAEASLELRERLEQVSASTDFLAAEKIRVPMTSLILAEITRVVPDQAYLLQLDWEGGTLQIQGMAEGAAALIAILDGSPMFGAPQFRSPVTPDRRTELEHFHVSVELTPEGG
ncbi:MAG TPA: PilN domain-containing protein [Geminicoccaceae bacterium]|jgi:general secretion pathway protein L|nr:PilN domain-containing protein [Geminicoccaceae bacterium]